MCGNTWGVPGGILREYLVSIISWGICGNTWNDRTNFTILFTGNSPVSLSKDSGLVDASSNCSSNSASANNTSTSMSNSLTQRLVNLNFGDRKDKRNSSGRSGSASTSGLGASSSKNSSQVRNTLGIFGRYLGNTWGILGERLGNTLVWPPRNTWGNI